MLDVAHPRKLEAARWASESLADGSPGFDRGRWRRAAEFGIQALTVSGEHGGSDASAVEAMLTFEGLGLGCEDNGAVFALAAQTFPAQMSLQRFGTGSQRDRWLPGLVDGSLVASFAVSEPDAGSDTSAIRTTATPTGDGGYRLDGTKSWVTLGPVCDLVIVFASTDRTAGQWGLTAFVVDATADGVDRGEAQAKLGLRTCPLGTMRFDGCTVSADAVLGRPGAGHTVFRAAVESERAFLYASQLGATERLLERTIERARTRAQFDRVIGGFQAVSNRIVDMKLFHEASRLMLYSAAARHDRGDSVMMAAALAKIMTSEMAVTSALDAIRIHGAEGYLDESGLGDELADAIGGLFVGGTTDVQRNIVAALLRLDRPLPGRSEPSR